MTPAQAAAKIWALVSGFPGERARKRQFLVVQCYVDASGKGDPDYLVIAGYIASAEAWAAFSEEWQERLDMRPSMPYFKMVDMAKSPERLERAGWFYRVIENHAVAAVSCVLSTSDLHRAVASTKWPSHLERWDMYNNPYYLGFKAIMYELAHEARTLGITEPIDFIFDEDSEKRYTLNMWDRLKLAGGPKIRPFLGDPPIYRNDQTTLPLQAADLYAWWVLKWEREGVYDGVQNLRFPWKARRNLPRLNFRMKEDDFRDQFAMMLSPRTYATRMLQEPHKVDPEWFDKAIEEHFPIKDKE